MKWLCTVVGTLCLGILCQHWSIEEKWWKRRTAVELGKQLCTVARNDNPDISQGKNNVTQTRRNNGKYINIKYSSFENDFNNPWIFEPLAYKGFYKHTNKLTYKINLNFDAMTELFFGFKSLIFYIV